MPNPPSLSEALDFGAEDLARNRDGRISPKQRERLQRWGKAARQRALLIFFSAVLAASTAIFWGIRQQITPLLWLGIAIALLNAHFTGLAARYQLRLRADIYNDDSVITLEGMVTRVIQPIGRIRLRSVRIAGRNLPVSQPIFAVIQHEQSYRFYLTRASGYLLAAELLVSHQPPADSNFNNSAPR